MIRVLAGEGWRLTYCGSLPVARMYSGFAVTTVVFVFVFV